MANTTITNAATTKTTLILGGTGKTGRRVADRLSARGLAVRIGSRSSQPAFDWENQATWAAALQGVTQVYVTYYPDVAAPGASDAIRAFCKAAKAARIQRLVLLSGRGEPEAQISEQIVRDAGIDWTIVRASWFAQNFSEAFMVDGVRSGELVLPASHVGEPFIDVDDIADVVTSALTEAGHSRTLYEVTGPRLLTFADAVQEIAEALDRPIQFVQVSAEDYAAGMKDSGVPPEVVSLVSYLFTEVLDGRNAHVTDGVRQALGRPARDFAEYARDAAATGVWSARA